VLLHHPERRTSQEHGYVFDPAALDPYDPALSLSSAPALATPCAEQEGSCGRLRAPTPTKFKGHLGVRR